MRHRYRGSSTVETQAKQIMLLHRVSFQVQPYSTTLMKTSPAPHQGEAALHFLLPEETSVQPLRAQTWSSTQTRHSLYPSRSRGTPVGIPAYSMAQQQQGKSPPYIDQASNKRLHNVLCWQLNTKRQHTILAHPFSCSSFPCSPCMWDPHVRILPIPRMLMASGVR